MPTPDRRLMLVHAHPDDETIGTGASMARYAADGAAVTLVTCTLGEEGEILLSREWRLNEGRLASRHRLNGGAVNRSQIQELRPLLLDLTVQGQTQQLARPGQQRRWLDRFAGEGLQALLSPVALAWRQWRQSAAALETVRRG